MPFYLISIIAPCSHLAVKLEKLFRDKKVAEEYEGLKTYLHVLHKRNLKKCKDDKRVMIETGLIFIYLF